MTQFTPQMGNVQDEVMRQARSLGQGCTNQTQIGSATSQIGVRLTPAEQAAVERAADFDLDTTPWETIAIF